MGLDRYGEEPTRASLDQWNGNKNDLFQVGDLSPKCLENKVSQNKSEGQDYAATEMSRKI